MRKYFSRIVLFSLAIFISCLADANVPDKDSSGFYDESYFSHVFQRDKTYRIYLPEGYFQMNKNFPVIYFFHGWGGRYFKDDNANLAYDKIQKLVDKYQVMLVMWDGNMEESEPRPYNIGNHQHVRFDIHMKDYFPEFVAHIDSKYRIINDRYSRGIIGFSMGGFMSYYIAGKFPQMVSAAVNLTGSTEFYIGSPTNHTSYPIRYTFPNLRDVQIRLHNSSYGELSCLNREINKSALYDGNLTYEYWEFEGGHVADKPGETVVFEKAMKFVVDAFKHPQPRNTFWDHYDLYSDFDVWDYAIRSNKDKPGYTYLRHVSPGGFGFYTLKWLPDAAPLTDYHAEITTAPVYQPESDYQIKKYNIKSDTLVSSIASSDLSGRLKFNLSGTGWELGIYKKGGNPKLTFLNYSINTNQRLIRVGGKNSFTVDIANLGEELDASKKITYSLSSNEKTISIQNNEGEFYWNKNQQRLSLPAVFVYCNKSATTDAEPASVKFNLVMKVDTLTFREEFDVPVFFDVPAFTDLSIDDGVLARDSIFGVGNGDGKVSPGEEIMVYTNGHRLYLYTDNPFVEHDNERMFCEALPAKWKDDGFSYSSIIKIADDCPKGQTIILLAKYDTKEYMPIKRNVYWGRITLHVE